jgi:hypothetical protein
MLTAAVPNGVIVPEPLRERLLASPAPFPVKESVTGVMV